MKFITEPFNQFNDALGLTRIKLSYHVIASYLCMLPGAIAYTYPGFALKEAVALLIIVAYLPRTIARLHRGRA